MLLSINPYTQMENGSVDLLKSDQLDAVIHQAHDAFVKWKNISTAERKALFLKLANVLKDDIDECARLQTIEMGMLLSESRTGLEKTIELIEWFANNFESILGDQEFDEYGIQGKNIYDPLGVIFGIAPWNFPFNQLLRAAVPNILAGNTMIYKHSSNVPFCAQKIQELFDKAGFPKGVYTNVFISSGLSEHVLSNPKIAGVNLTGSEGAGKAVGSLAGKYLKPSVLELGGNDALVVCENVDIKNAVDIALKGRMRNGGQACNASKRFIVLSKHYESFCEMFAKKMSELIPGDPLDSQTTLQPLSSKAAIEEIDLQVKKAIQSGAKLLTGGHVLDRKGYFYAPTVLAEVTPQVSSFHEEIFGPVASIIKSESIEESIHLANDSEFGLSACVCGNDINELKKVASQLKGGMIFCNAPAGSRASLPFGGVGKSGYGKENGAEGLKAFTNKKVIIY